MWNLGISEKGDFLPISKQLLVTGKRGDRKHGDEREHWSEIAKKVPTNTNLWIHLNILYAPLLRWTSTTTAERSTILTHSRNWISPKTEIIRSGRKFNSKKLRPSVRILGTKHCAITGSAHQLQGKRDEQQGIPTPGERHKAPPRYICQMHLWTQVPAFTRQDSPMEIQAITQATHETSPEYTHEVNCNPLFQISVHRS